MKALSNVVCLDDTVGDAWRRRRFFGFSRWFRMILLFTINMFITTTRVHSRVQLERKNEEDNCYYHISWCRCWCIYISL